MEGFVKKDKMNEVDSKFKKEIHSKVIRAGKRTYFFDVKSTRNDEYYLTMTESKKRFESEGKFHYEKHKIFLYKEDFDKFADSLQEIIDYIREKQPVQDMYRKDVPENVEDRVPELIEEEVSNSDYTSVEFEDLNS